MVMDKVHEIRWGWVSMHKNAPQTETFKTPNDALLAMQERQGVEFTIEDAAIFGFRLALVKVTIDVLMVTTPINELTQGETK